MDRNQKGRETMESNCPNCSGCIAFLPWEAEYNYGDTPQVYRRTCSVCGAETWFIPNRCPESREGCQAICPEFTFRMF